MSEIGSVPNVQPQYNIPADTARAPDKIALAHQQSGIAPKDLGTVVLSIDGSAAKPKETTKDGQNSFQENLELTKRVVFTLDDESGESVVNFMDARGRKVLQVPSEEFLKIKRMMSKNEQNTQSIIDKTV